MPHSHALFTAEDAPRSDGVRTVGSAESVMPNGLTDADDADDAKYHGGAFYSATVHKSVTILEPMSKSHMASEGDPQVALAASHTEFLRVLWSRVGLTTPHFWQGRTVG